MRYKNGVTLGGLHTKLTSIFSTIDDIFQIYRYTPFLIEAVTTKNGFGPYHVIGRAIDLHLPTLHRKKIKLALECRLGSEYSVRIFPNKIHIAYTAR